MKLNSLSLVTALLGMAMLFAAIVSASVASVKKDETDVDALLVTIIAQLKADPFDLDAVYQVEQTFKKISQRAQKAIGEFDLNMQPVTEEEADDILAVRGTVASHTEDMVPRLIAIKQAIINNGKFESVQQDLSLLLKSQRKYAANLRKLFPDTKLLGYDAESLIFTTQLTALAAAYEVPLPTDEPTPP